MHRDSSVCVKKAVTGELGSYKTHVLCNNF